MSSNTKHIGSSDRINTPPIKHEPGPHLIPHGTKRVIIFDTNAYRVMTAKTPLADCHGKALRLRQCEQASGQGRRI